MYRLKMCLLWLCCACGCAAAGQGRVNPEVSKVYVVFKTHLDVGFTDLSSVVTERYVRDFIPKALDVAERLEAEGTGERYVWTTGSWLIWKYLHTASPEAVRRLEAAIRRGHIVWNGVPYTVETEVMNRDLLETNLLLARKLDERYGKKTVAAKMTDVPGHTRSIIAPLNRAGIGFLHIGVNPASPVPEIPSVCRWRDGDGNELILVYQQNYGTEDLLPDGKTAISVNFTGDNHGPHSYEAVKAIYADLRKRYPNARLVASSFNEIAQDLYRCRETLPVVTSEIGDTWIHGYGGAPIRMARFRALSALYSKWLKEKRLDRESEASLNFAVELGLIAEHTQGMDVKTHLGHWDKYDMDSFLAARGTEPFRRMEQSWEEVDNYLFSAIGYLPEPLRKEALAELDRVGKVEAPVFGNEEQARVASGEWKETLLKDGILELGGLSYQQYDSHDYETFLNNYLTERYGWALDDLGKTGLEHSEAVSVSLSAQVVRREVYRERKGVRVVSQLAFPQTGGVDGRVFPERIFVNCWTDRHGRRAEIELTIFRKPAVRLPESYFLSFGVRDLLAVVAEKVGQPVDLLDVVEKGNRQMHGIDRYVDLVTASGTVRIWSETAFLVSVGEARCLNYSVGRPDPAGGVHFNLSNNVWNTNFSMWNEGSLTYRFRVERL